jgi:GTP-binding protein EngB required for normal cell division
MAWNMKKHTLDIREDLDRVDSLLEQESLFSLPVRERKTLRDQSKGLRIKFSNIEGRYLTVGFLGGTGVGKSSLLNALAHENIASSSYRRPHTERVLIYRHDEVDPLPQAELHNIPWQDVTHRADPIKALLLCDLPDFDSILTEHKARVMAFLEHLDLLVWVTSPDKYADADFYNFLETTPKARQYFTFVLNKVDLLQAPREDNDVSDRIARVLKSFRGHLGKKGMDDPLIFALSAENAEHSDPSASWNQFHLFRRHLLEQRSIKAITAIKAANLEVAVRKLFTPFERERRNLEGVHGILRETINRVKEKRSGWDHAARQTLQIWMEKRYSQSTVGLTPGDLWPLVGPGYALGLLLKTVSGARFRPVDSPDALDYLPPEETTATLRRPLQWLQDRLHQRFLRENLPPRLWEEVSERINLEMEFEQLGQALSLTAEGLDGQRGPALRMFRLNQYLVYGLLTLCLLAVLMGERTLREFFNNPGFGSFFGLFVSGIETLFSPRGLTALLSYALIGLFFSIRFYRGYARKMKAMAQRHQLRITKALARDWSDCLTATTRKLESLEKDVRKRLDALSRLWRKEKSG